MALALGPLGASARLTPKKSIGLFHLVYFLRTMVIARMFTDIRHLVWYFAPDRVFIAKAMKSVQANYRVLRAFD